MYLSPVKNGRSHVLTTSCIKKEHVGWRPSCYKLVGFNHGCPRCSVKKKNLLNRDPTKKTRN